MRAFPPRLGWMLAHFTLNAAFARLTLYGSLFPLLLRQFHLDDRQVGVALSLVHFCGLVSPLAMPWVARLGFRRAFLAFYTVRQLFLSGVLLSPLVYAAAPGLLFTWLCVCIVGFGLFRAVAETGFYPWFQGIVPGAVRGAFNAAMTALGTATGVATALAAGAAVRGASGPGPYLWLFGIGIALALLGVAAALPVRDGDERRTDYSHASHRSEMAHALRDRNFVAYLVAQACAAIGTAALFGFSALFLREQVGFSAGQVVWLDMSGALGGLAASVPAGRLADRQGSRPVMALGVGGLLLAPLALLALRTVGPSLPLAVAVGVLAGGSHSAWLVAMDRYLFVGAVPPERSAGYSAVFYAAQGLAGGVGPIVAGVIAAAGVGWSLRGPGLLGSTYTPLYAWCALMLSVTLACLTRLRPDRDG